MDTGLRLRTAREAKGLTIDALARATRVQPRILEAIERNDSHALPPRPYGRGCVRAYATEVGLEPIGTVRDFFSQFIDADVTANDQAAADAGPADTTAPGDARRRAVFGTILTCGLAAVFILFIGRGMMTSDSEPRPVGTSGAEQVAPASAAGVVPAGDTTGVSPGAGVAAPTAPLTVVLEATAPAWIHAVADGRRVVYRLMQPGERHELRADEFVRVRVGDAGAVRWQINGRPASAMGAPGEVRTVTVTGANADAVK